MQIRNRVRELRTMRAGDLRPSPRNWRTHPPAQRDALQGVLAEIGYADALLARELEDGSLELIDGHLRAETTPDMEVPVLVLDVNEEEAGRILLTLDPMAALAGVDTEALAALMEELNFDSDAVEAMLNDLALSSGVRVEDVEIVEDEVPEPPDSAITQPGDLWVLGDHRLLCGDATKPEDLDRVLDGENANLVLTDPPYGVSYVGGTEEALTIQNDDQEGLLELLESVFPLLAQRTNPGAGWYVAAPAGPQFLSFAQVLDELGVWRQTLVWVKDSMVLGHSDYHYRHEAIFYGWTPGSAHRAPPDRTRTTILEHARPKASREHPTMKPVALWAELLANSSGKGDLVLDPFCGSGTTVIAAEQLGRRAGVLELEPRYCDVIVNRWQELTGKDASFDGGPSFASVAEERKVAV
jgi:DNA modification methylase